jgi:cell division protein FtsQ
MNVAPTSAAARIAPRLRQLASRGRRPAGVPALPTLPPHFGRWLVGVGVLCCVLLAGYMLWFRDSSFVEVDRVEVSGATSADAARVRATLTSVARSMTTLRVDQARLEQAVAGYPVVRGLEISSDFPHTLRIRVLEHVPAAIALVGGARVPVASDGTVLRGVTAKGSLPTVHAKGGLKGSRLADPVALHAAAVAGAAPVLLRRYIEDVYYESARGLVAQLRDGPELVFGSAGRLRAKWIAAARVLADSDAQGATYIDVRLPGRPAVGGLAAASATPVAPTEPASPTPATPRAADPATAAASPADPAGSGIATQPATGVPAPTADATTPPVTATQAPPTGVAPTTPTTP